VIGVLQAQLNGAGNWLQVKLSDHLVHEIAPRLYG
ncbi:MAG: hypothetical protein CFH38_01464, partial [Alphaproteobacteria bacterium MarineAlpha10_Bin1]